MFVILEAVGAKMTIIDANNNRSFTIEVAKYLKVDMKKKVIVNVKLPTLASTLFKFRSYKVGQWSYKQSFVAHDLIVLLLILR